MIQNTSAERVDNLIDRSNRIYEAIDPTYDGEPRYRRMLRFGMNSIALSLRQNNNLEVAGTQLIRLPVALPRQNGPLDALANTYADVERATIDSSGSHESDARHAIHLMKIAVPYAKEFYPKLNLGKVAAYSLLHDVIEAYAGDVASLGMSAAQAQEKHDNEAKALLTLREQYGAHWPEFVTTIEAYESLDDSEARFTKTIDKIDPAFTHLSNRGVELKNRFGLSRDTFLAAIGQTTRRMAAYSGEFPQLMGDREEIMHRVADVSFQKAA